MSLTFWRCIMRDFKICVEKCGTQKAHISGFGDAYLSHFNNSRRFLLIPNTIFVPIIFVTKYIRNGWFIDNIRIFDFIMHRTYCPFHFVHNQSSRAFEYSKHSFAIRVFTFIMYIINSFDRYIAIHIGVYYFTKLGNLDRFQFPLNVAYCCCCCCCCKKKYIFQVSFNN